MENDPVIADLKMQITDLAHTSAVLTMFCQCLIHTLSKAGRDSVEASLRSGLDQVLALGDDSPQAAAHHSAVLATANVLFAEFERQRQASASGDGDHPSGS